jgi:hypothetical protein
MTSEIFKKWPMSWNVELQQKSRKIFAGSWQLCRTLSFRFFEKYTAGIFISPHHIPGTANGHGSYEKFEDFLSHTVGKLHP